MSEYIGITDEESLEHYGVKGAKWGYNKGKRNGKRTAQGSNNLNPREKEALRRQNARNARDAEAKRQSTEYYKKQSSANQSSGRQELDRINRVREATTAAQEKARKNSQAKAARNASDAMSKGHAELDRRQRVREATAVASSKARTSSQAAASRRASDAMSKGHAELARRAQVRSVANSVAKRVKAAYNGKKRQDDFTDYRQARTANANGVKERRKKRNRQLNRIDGLNAKQGPAARRQIAMYYNRRNRKNMKNA